VMMMRTCCAGVTGYTSLHIVTSSSDCACVCVCYDTTFIPFIELAGWLCIAYESAACFLPLATRAQHQALSQNNWRESGNQRAARSAQTGSTCHLAQQTHVVFEMSWRLPEATTYPTDSLNF
jgi:hypothetical protein